LALGIANSSRLRCWPLDAGARTGAQFAQHLERIARSIRVEPVGAAIEAHPPGRSVAGHGILLVARDRVLAHAREVIIGMIVLAHVLEAEAPVLVLAQPPFGGAVRRLAVAAGPLANRHRPGRLALLLGLDPDPVEQRR